MIKISDNAISELCSKLEIAQSSLSFLGGGREDSDGTVYTCNDGHTVLKIIALTKDKNDAFDKLLLQIKWAGILGDNGISCAYPKRNNLGNLYETCEEGEYLFIAYVMDFVKGKNPENPGLTKELLTNWGQLTGRTHALTKEFSKNLPSDTDGFMEEIDSFEKECKNPEIKLKWKEIQDELISFGTCNNAYGFIHNDNHQRNILVNNKEITLIDFDCATKQFFVQDIITPAQGIMFDVTGGMLSPLRDADTLKSFVDSFINGYEKSNHLDNIWYERLNSFINYRRLLLYTCMQDWVCSVPDLKKSFTENIMNPPKIF